MATSRTTLTPTSPLDDVDSVNRYIKALNPNNRGPFAMDTIINPQSIDVLIKDLVARKNWLTLDDKAKMGREVPTFLSEPEYKKHLGRILVPGRNMFAETHTLKNLAKLVNGSATTTSSGAVKAFMDKLIDDIKNYKSGSFDTIKLTRDDDIKSGRVALSKVPSNGSVPFVYDTNINDNFDVFRKLKDLERLLESGKDVTIYYEKMSESMYGGGKSKPIPKQRSSTWKPVYKKPLAKAKEAAAAAAEAAKKAATEAAEAAEAAEATEAAEAAEKDATLKSPFAPGLRAAALRAKAIVASQKAEEARKKAEEARKKAEEADERKDTFESFSDSINDKENIHKQVLSALNKLNTVTLAEVTPYTKRTFAQVVNEHSPSATGGSIGSGVVDFFSNLFGGSQIGAQSGGDNQNITEAQYLEMKHKYETAKQNFLHKM
jgi:chemotaxis protein histidine kinase CheA